ncbi:MAG: hypothetical protein F6K47_04535 [Symploca sp. SIO2E6]|nr:hypothetical protein [Symploca sp. SIO2E6]
MATNTGVIVTQAVGTGSAVLTKKLSVAIAGTATAGSAVADSVYKVKSTAEAESLFGTIADGGTLPLALSVLQRYGLGSIYVIKPSVGNEVAALDEFSTMPEIAAIAFPGNDGNATAIVDKLKEVADIIKAIAIVDFDATDAVADVYTKRAAGGEFSKADPRIIYVFPSLKNSDDPTQIEPLSLHLMGVIAGLNNYGVSPLNKPILGADAVNDASMTFSFSDQNADTEKLLDQGIVTVNQKMDTSLVLWGGRNSLYKEDSTDVLTWINAVRARDEITKMIEERSLKFLSSESVIATANLLRESYVNCLSAEAAKGAIKSDYRVTFNEASSDLSKGMLDYSIEFAPWLPIELITATVKISIKVGG